jgi:TP53 regulating kinase-like protein
MTDSNITKVLDLLHVPLTVISQGAEAIVFKSNTHPYLSSTDEYIIKYRPPKLYRHPKIDTMITKNRTAGEVKFMNKLTKLDIPSPNLIGADFNNGIIFMEMLGQLLPNGMVSSLKNWFWYLEKELSPDDCLDEKVHQMCLKVGHLIARLHLNDMIHGDLTTSNILLHHSSPYLIDFGLSSYSGLAEDKAVDIYVFERAILSTHSVYSETYNKWFLEGYEEIHKSKQYAKSNGVKKLNDTLSRLADVRLRGRKRSMLG